jgi:Ni2+-binding GTPase involved in maturation of urease and hydrogenase
MHQMRLILVGGFLGAGKTTLLAHAAERLAGQGRRVGLITNDQATHLVDTQILQAATSAVREVTGGCFCCRFEDLVTAIERLTGESAPDVLICEPVGSCTDLSATVIQPLKRHHGDQFRVAPYSVLVDPSRARQALSDGLQSLFPQSVIYIYLKQLEEADLIVLNKADTLSSDELSALEETLAERFPGKPLFAISALTGAGVGDWLEFVTEQRPSGQVVAEVDYDEYARGEAALGWLNAMLDLRAERKTDWTAFCLEVLQAMRAEFRRVSAEVAHVKLYLTAGGGCVVANLTSSEGLPQIRGSLQGAHQEAVLLVNARVHVGPRQLRTVLERCLRSAAGGAVRVVVDDIQSFAPARPQPTHRFNSPV